MTTEDRGPGTEREPVGGARAGGCVWRVYGNENGKGWEIECMGNRREREWGQKAPQIRTVQGLCLHTHPHLGTCAAGDGPRGSREPREHGRKPAKRGPGSGTPFARGSQGRVDGEGEGEGKGEREREGGRWRGKGCSPVRVRVRGRAAVCGPAFDEQTCTGAGFVIEGGVRRECGDMARARCGDAA